MAAPLLKSLVGKPYELNLSNIEFDKDVNGDLVVLGEGASGSVYQGKLLAPQICSVAIKKVLLQRSTPTNLLNNARICHSFNVESELLYRLKHNNIVKFIGAAERLPTPTVQGSLYLVMELLPFDHTLNILCVAKKDDHFLKVKWLHDISISMAFLHGKDIIHGDIKPQNIIVDANNVAKLIDFGSSRERPNNMATRSIDKAMQGTERYMDVIFFKSDFSIKKENDIFSFAITAEQVASGKDLPYSIAVQSKQLEGSNGFKQFLLDGGRPDCADLPAVIHIALKQLLSECWQEEPNKRLPMRFVADRIFAILEKMSPSPTAAITVAQNFHMFASYAWGAPPSFETQQKVKAIVDILLRLGFTVWFDLYNMNKRATLEQMMTEGIDNSSVILVFVTQLYTDKIANQGIPNDNCQCEWNYARLKNKLRVAIVLDDNMSNPASWSGPVAAALGGKLYADMRVTATSTLESRVTVLANRLSTEFQVIPASLSKPPAVIYMCVFLFLKKIYLSLF